MEQYAGNSETSRNHNAKRDEPIKKPDSIQIIYSYARYFKLKRLAYK